MRPYFDCNRAPTRDGRDQSGLCAMSTGSNFNDRRASLPERRHYLQIPS